MRYNDFKTIDNRAELYEKMFKELECLPVYNVHIKQDKETSYACDYVSHVQVETILGNAEAEQIGGE